MRVLLCVIAAAMVVTAGAGCSSSGSGADSGTDGAVDAPADSVDAAPLSPDCQRLYDCCVGPAAQTADFCVGLVGQNICDVWLQSYAMAGIQCS